MSIGINFNAYGKMENGDRIRLMKKYGFDHAFLVSDRADVEEAFALCEANGIIVDSCHGPYGHINDIWLDKDEGDDMYFEIADAILLNAKHHVPVLVQHLSSSRKPPRISDIGYERWKKLIDLGRENGVRLAFENQRKIANLAFVLEEFEDAGFCWDCGHEGCFAFGKEYMPIFGERIIALHLHDNNKEYNHDLHMIPFDASIDFDHVCEMLRRYGYKGTVMLEVHESGYEDIDPEEFYRRAAEAARRIENKI